MTVNHSRQQISDDVRMVARGGGPDHCKAAVRDAYPQRGLTLQLWCDLAAQDFELLQIVGVRMQQQMVEASIPQRL